MPRVSIKRKDYKVSDLSVYISAKMYEKKLRQSDLAKKLGISQPAFSNRLEKGLFGYEDMLVLFHDLGSTDEEIVKIMRINENIDRRAKK